MWSEVLLWDRRKGPHSRENRLPGGGDGFLCGKGREEKAKTSPRREKGRMDRVEGGLDCGGEEGGAGEKGKGVPRILWRGKGKEASSSMKKKVSCRRIMRKNLGQEKITMPIR